MKKLTRLGLRRRQILVGAGSAAGALAITRVLGLHHLGPDLPIPAVPAFRDAHQTQLDGIVGPKTADLLNSAQDESTRWLILLASPEFQLK